MCPQRIIHMLVKRGRAGLHRDCAPVPRLTAVLALLRERLPGMQVVVVAVLPRGWAGPKDFFWPNRFTKVDIFLRNVVHIDQRFCVQACNLLQAVASPCAVMHCRVWTSLMSIWRQQLPAWPT